MTAVTEPLTGRIDETLAAEVAPPTPTPVQAAPAPVYTPRPRPQTRPAGRITYDDAGPSALASLFTWGVAAALVVGMGLVGAKVALSGTGAAPAAISSSGDVPTAEKSVATARALLAKGSFEEAATEARLALTLLGPQATLSKTREARAVQAEALVGLQEYEAAERAFDELSHDFPEDPTFLKGYEAARAALQQARLAEANATLAKARAQFGAHHYREAADLADSASLIYSGLDHGAASRILCRQLAAEAYARQGAFRAAIYAWNDVLQAHPNDARALAGLADAERQLTEQPALAAAEPPVRSVEPRPVAVVHPRAQVKLARTGPGYPTAAKKTDEFYGEKAKVRRTARLTLPGADTRQGPRQPSMTLPGPDDPYNEGPPPPGVPPPPGQGPPTAPAARAQLPQAPRLPSLNYPNGGRQGGIPGYANGAGRNQGSFPAYQGAGYNTSGLPGYNSDRGNRSSGTGIPGY